MRSAEVEIAPRSRELRPPRVSGVLEAIGDTPLVTLQRIAPKQGARVLAKLEGSNPGGSVKDRPALWMIEQAEKTGLRHLMILGSGLDDLNGQTLTFYAGDRVRFVASKWERYHPAAVSAELDPAAGFLTKAQHRAKLHRWLAPYRVVDGATFDGIDVVRLCRRGVAGCDALDPPESAPVLFKDLP